MQCNLIWLIPLRIIFGISFGLCYITVGGYSFPWLQAMAIQLGSYCVSVCIELWFRRTHTKLKAQEAERRAASKLEGLLTEGAAASASLVGS